MLASMLHARLLTYLDQVARSGSIRKAASQLNVAASAINRQILALERDLGTPLFVRMHKQLRLTAAGEVILTHIRHTQKDYERALAQIENLKGLRHGEVTIATMQSIASELLPSVVASFLERHPGVRITIRVVTGISQAVLADEADLGIGFNLAVDPGLREYASVPIGFGAVVRTDHPLARQPSTTIIGAAAYPLILHDAGMSIRATLDRALSRLNAEYSVATTTNSIDYMKRAARAGLGVAFLTRLDVREELNRGELAYISLRDLPIPPNRLAVICRNRNVLSGVVGIMAEELTKGIEIFTDAERDG